MTKRTYLSADDRGYTLLFAVIAAGLVMGVAAFILSVSRKQYELSASARNSLYSFYAADSGIECAVNSANWGSSGFSSTTGGTLLCGGHSVTLSSSGCPAVTPSSIVVNDPSNAGNTVRQQCGYVSLLYTNDSGAMVTNQCAQVIMTTGWDPATNQPETIIDSRGYNRCTTSGPVGPDTAASDAVERALRLIQSGVW